MDSYKRRCSIRLSKPTAMQEPMLTATQALVNCLWTHCLLGKSGPRPPPPNTVLRFRIYGLRILTLQNIITTIILTIIVTIVMIVIIAIIVIIVVVIIVTISSKRLGFLPELDPLNRKLLSPGCSPETLKSRLRLGSLQSCTTRDHSMHACVCIRTCMHMHTHACTCILA